MSVGSGGGGGGVLKTYSPPFVPAADFRHRRISKSLSPNHFVGGIPAGHSLLKRNASNGRGGGGGAGAAAGNVSPLSLKDSRDGGSPPASWTAAAASTKRKSLPGKLNLQTNKKFDPFQVFEVDHKKALVLEVRNATSTK